MLLSLLTVLFFAKLTDASFCYLTGCANVTQCQCMPFFFFCDLSTDKNGLCTMTESGVWINVFGGGILLALLVFAIICLCCCCCCKYRGTKKVIHTYEDPRLQKL